MSNIEAIRHDWRTLSPDPARRFFASVGLAWAVGALVVGLWVLGGTLGDEPLWIVSLALGCPVAALLAAIAATRGKLLAAGALLIVSAGAPADFFYVGNLIAFSAGVAALGIGVFRALRS